MVRHTSNELKLLEQNTALLNALKQIHQLIAPFIGIQPIRMPVENRRISFVQTSSANRETIPDDITESEMDVDIKMMNVSIASTESSIDILDIVRNQQNRIPTQRLAQTSTIQSNVAPTVKQQQNRIPTQRPAQTRTNQPKVTPMENMNNGSSMVETMVLLDRLKPSDLTKFNVKPSSSRKQSKIKKQQPKAAKVPKTRKIEAAPSAIIERRERLPRKAAPINLKEEYLAKIIKNEI